MLTSVDIEIPQDIKVAAGTNVRATLRRAIANRLRPRFNDLRKQAQQVTIYPSIADKFAVEQVTAEDSIAFALVNVSPIANILEMPGGSPAHVIEQEAHFIPVINLMNWLTTKGVEAGGLVPLAFMVRRVLAKRNIVIHHPGTRPDTPVQLAVDAAEPQLLAAAENAVDYWIDRFGVTEESGE